MSITKALPVYQVECVHGLCFVQSPRMIISKIDSEFNVSESDVEERNNHPLPDVWGDE